MKLFKTSYIQVVKDCQVYFGFDLPSLSELSKWFTANRLSLNIDKTCYSVFGIRKNDLQNFQLKINGKPISSGDNCKYLWILIDCKLTWQDHIDGVYK